LMHSGLLRHDESLDRGGEEIARLEISGRPNTPVLARVALLHDYESLWAHDSQPHSIGARYWRQVMLFYSALRSLGLDVDIRHPDSDLTEYALIVAPALQLMGATRAAHLTAAAQRSRFVFGPRTAYRTPTGRVHEDGQPGPLRGLLGCSLLNFDGLRPGLTVRVGPHTVETWAENYRLLGGEALHTYSDGPLAGTPAVVCHRNVTTVGAWSASLVTELLTAELAAAGIPTMLLPDGVRVTRQDGSETWMNFNQVQVSLPNGHELDPVSFTIVDRS
jgi:beta-galactosidase